MMRYETCRDFGDENDKGARREAMEIHRIMASGGRLYGAPYEIPGDDVPDEEVVRSANFYRWLLRMGC